MRRLFIFQLQKLGRRSVLFGIPRYPWGLTHVQNLQGSLGYLSIPFWNPHVQDVPVPSETTTPRMGAKLLRMLHLGRNLRLVSFFRIPWDSLGIRKDSLGILGSPMFPFENPCGKKRCLPCDVPIRRLPAIGLHIGIPRDPGGAGQHAMSRVEQHRTISNQKDSKGLMVILEDLQERHQWGPYGRASKEGFRPEAGLNFR